MSDKPLRFFNYASRQLEAECAQQGHPVVPVVGADQRWFIKMHFAGFNSAANNGIGYASKARAEAACRRYQSDYWGISK